ncbi:MAG: phosphotyrosine protein phosphatase [Desulfobulbaceae bacterium A2]|nr:MAG: phosphotyrosine protein phosphatase [Desulfobulbaceae bacterium A2]
MDAINTHQVFDWLWTSGQLSERDILSLPELGVEAVINLALPTTANALAGEAEQVTRLGLAYIQIPVEWEAPRPEQFRHFIGVLHAFAGHTIWLHCAKNMRVSVFLYLYRRLVLGEEEQDAAHPLRAVWTPNATWQAFIREVHAVHARQPFSSATSPRPR